SPRAAHEPRGFRIQEGPALRRTVDRLLLARAREQRAEDIGRQLDQGADIGNAVPVMRRPGALHLPMASVRGLHFPARGGVSTVGHHIRSSVFTLKYRV